MKTGRLEAFTDGVMAVIITIMVLEIKVPHGVELESLEPLVSSLLGYALSFVFIGIYWNNHHHLMHAAERVTGGALWANLHLLFWLSLVPVVTTWVGENPTARLPTILYGVVLFFAGVAYFVLVRVLVAINGKSSALARAVGSDRKGAASATMYLVAVGLAFVRPWLAQLVYVVVALMWLVPDRRIERTLAKSEA
ncbi:MAG TPA: TMEM175 family protein [Polyangiaceae bacterium]